MNKLEKGKVTIATVNYKTEELTRLCLRSIRKFTNYPYKVVVVDNNSADSSLDYLRSLKWIELIERQGVKLSGSKAQGTALDLALEKCDTEYFLAIHTDTFFHSANWLEWLVSQISDDNKIACAGSGKLDLKPRWEVILKKMTDYKEWIRKMKQNNPDKSKFYIRAICAIYRTEILKKENLTFSMDVDKGMTCAQQMYVEMLKRGYKTKVITDFKISEYVFHLAHATRVFNKEFVSRTKTEKKCKAKLEKIMNLPVMKSVASDNSLDE